MQDPQTYKIIGLMSGTSGDGLDIAYCEFSYNGSWSYDIPYSTTVPFPEKLNQSIIDSHFLTSEELRLLDIDFGRWMGEEVKAFCLNSHLSPIAISSHGHTVFHQPELKNTLQIGNGWSMHIASGLPIINDFRMLDVQLGGQGAPLVPIGDKHLFSDYDYCLNLGGIANISFQNKDKRTAFDVCPFNLLLNYYAGKKGLAYDDGGIMARNGKPIPGLEARLNDLSFYKKTGGRSLGRENMEKDFIPLLENEDSPIEDILATLVAHYTYQISKIMVGNKGKSLIVTGGGAYHRYFIEQLAEALKDKVELVIPDKTIINFKEALIFAFLGVLKIRGEINCLSSVTGAEKDSVGGVIYGDL